MKPEQKTPRCPLRNQTGTQAIKNFTTILASLPPAARAAFEAERQARQREIDTYVARYGYQS